MTTPTAPLTVVDTPPPQPPIEALAEGFMRSLRYQERSEKTIVIYAEAIRQLTVFLKFRRLPLDPTVPTFGDILQEFFEHLQERGNKGSTVATRWRALHAFFAWMVRKGHIDAGPNGGRRSAGPMDRLDPPKITVTAPPVLTTDQVKAMLAECEVRRNDGPMWRFTHRRDRALLLTMFDTGIRRAEVAAIQLKDLNLNEQQVHIPHGKGDKARTVALGLMASEAIDDYLIVRNQHAHARSPYLWLAPTGRLGYSGVGDVIDRVARAAGIAHKIHPHLFRHTWASNYLSHSEAQEGDLMRLAGWSSSQMLRRYGASAAEQRALAAAKRMGIADRLLASRPFADERDRRLAKTSGSD
jgi:site-specific recombinase XerD